MREEDMLSSTMVEEAFQAFADELDVLESNKKVNSFVKEEIGSRVRLYEKLAVEGEVPEEEKRQAYNEAQKRRHLSLYLKKNKGKGEEEEEEGGGEDMNDDR